MGLSKSEKDELVCSYAALMLHDDGVEVTVDNLNKIIKNSGNTVEPYWPMLFVKALKKVDITDLCTSVASGPAAGGAAGAVADDAAAPAEAEKKEERVEEATDVNMGGLFGDDDDY